MPGSAQSAPLHRSEQPSDNALYLTGLQQWLPLMLSAIAGTVDVISFLSLKLFTAHITGNLVVIAALLVRGGPPNLTQILAVPVFVLAVAGAWLLAKALDRRGSALVKPLLLVQFLLLSGVLVLSVLYAPQTNPRGAIAGLTAMIAVSAMACQFALLRLAVPGAPSTAVMTGNLAKTVLSLLDTESRTEPVTQNARQQLQDTLKLMVGFLAGCLAGAAAVSWFGEWAWSLAVALAGLALLLAARKPRSAKLSLAS